MEGWQKSDFTLQRLQQKNKYSPKSIAMPLRKNAMHDSLQKPPRSWREIAEELLREPNTEQMSTLLKELNRASDEPLQSKAEFLRKLRIGGTP